MKYSIIIPVYNVENKLNRCIESILHQAYTDYEIILINDGSKDRSAEICKNYAETYGNIIFIDKENGGASSARNVGIAKANGDYILFVDSDDYVKDSFFSQIDGNETENGLTVFSYDIVTAKRSYQRHIPDELLNSGTSFFEKSKILILSRTINSPYAKIFSKKLIDSHNLKFDEKMPVAEDFNFCLAYLMNCKDVKVMNQSIYCYDNTNENSLVKKRKIGLIDVYPYVFDTAFSTVEKSYFGIDEKKQLYRIVDKLHTDSFVTCVMEELKDNTESSKAIKKNMKSMCEKFYLQYSTIYGYQNIVHFAVRFCIKHKCVNVLYYSSVIYSKIRG